MSNVKSVSIVCRVSSGEIATTVEHIEAEKVLVQDAQTEGAKSYVMIPSRRFVAHSRTPLACTGAIERAARAEYGYSVPVTVAFA